MAGEELIGGIHAVTAAVRHQPGEVLEIWVDRARRDRPLQQLEEQARSSGILVHSASRRELDAMLPDTRHQGVAARVAESVAAGGEGDLDQLLRGSREPVFLLVLDGIQDPHNLGACLRTADAAGVQGVIIPKDRAVGLTATVRKVASGAAETVPLFQVTNLARTLRELQDAGVWLIGLAGEATEELYQIDLTGPVALVLGAEGKGLRRLTRETCDRIARIPMRGTVESLNVSVAAGVCLFEALRQRSTTRSI